MRTSWVTGSTSAKGRRGDEGWRVVAVGATEGRRRFTPRLVFVLLLLGLLDIACRDSATPVASNSAGDGGPALGTRTSTAPRSVHRSYRAMGTQITFTAYTRDEALAIAAFEEAAAEFRRIEDLLTVWKPDSEIARINRAAGRAPVVVSEETLKLLLEGRRFYEWSDGRFDLSFGALAGLWKFDHDRDDRIPDPKEVKAKLPLVDYRKVRIDEKDRSVFLPKEGMRLHLGGLGKGYAVDKAVALLRARGLLDFMVQAGGDLYVAGKKGDRAFRVGIRDPRGPASSFFAFAELSDTTFSTSGDYERFFIHEGQRYHHIIDPKTGEPARVLRSATVMADSAMLADGLSTVLMLIGVEPGLALVERLPGVGAVLVDAANEVHVSERLRDRVKILRPPKSGG